MVGIYCTSFCNFGHSLKNGKPIAHECYVLPIAALQAERDGNIELAQQILSEQGKGPVVNGRSK
jgi:hypothetical protein